MFSLGKRLSVQSGQVSHLNTAEQDANMVCSRQSMINVDFDFYNLNPDVDQ